MKRIIVVLLVCFLLNSFAFSEEGEKYIDGIECERYFFGDFSILVPSQWDLTHDNKGVYEIWTFTSLEKESALTGKLSIYISQTGRDTSSQMPINTVYSWFLNDCNIQVGTDFEEVVCCGQRSILFDGFVTKPSIKKTIGFCYTKPDLTVGVLFSNTKGDNEELDFIRAVSASLLIDGFETETNDGVSNEDENSETASLIEYVVLEKGSKGEDVQKLQQRLIDLHWLNDKADGNFGGKTQKAVEKFQNAVSIPVTGVADIETQEKLYSDDAPEAKLDISRSTVSLGSYSNTVWSVEGQEFSLNGDQTKTIDTSWGRFRFYANGEYEQLN